MTPERALLIRAMFLARSVPGLHEASWRIGTSDPSPGTIETCSSILEAASALEHDIRESLSTKSAEAQSA